MGNDNKKIICVETNVINFLLSFSFISLMASEEKIFEYFFNHLPFILPWQANKFSDWDKIHKNRRGLLKKHFSRKNSKYLQ